MSVVSEHNSYATKDDILALSNQMSNLFVRMDNKMDGIENRLNKRIDELDAKMNAKFNDLDARFNKVELKISILWVPFVIIFGAVVTQIIQSSAG